MPNKQLTPEEEYDLAFNDETEDQPGGEEQSDDEQDPEKEVIQHEGRVDDGEGGDGEEGGEAEGEGGEAGGEATGEEPGEKKPESGPTLEEQLAAVKAERDSWEHKYRSDEGRFRAAQLKMQELSKKPQQPSKEQFLAALQSEEKYKEFCQDYPDIAEVLNLQAGYLRKAIIGELQPTIESLQHEASLRQQDAQVIARQRQVDILNQRVPNWKELVASDGFKSWAQQQPPYKREIILNSQDAEETASVLQDYMLYTRVAEMEQKNHETKTKQNKNQQILERSRTVPQRSTGAPKALPNDFDAVFDSITEE